MPLTTKKTIYRVLNSLNKNAVHLFLLSPPLCGSTLVQQLISTSPKATTFEQEGQWLPEVQDILGCPERWDPQLKVDWNKVRKTFNSYWSPWKPVRFEKSPPHLMRAQQLQEEFNNSHFLITIRNPYAQIEGMLRRQWMPSAKSAAEFWVMTARTQISNIKSLQNNFFFSYEYLVSEPNRCIENLISFVPQLQSLSPDILFTAHNVTGQPIKGIKNLNEIKISNLSQMDIHDINSVLSRNLDVLQYFSYTMHFGQGRIFHGG
ncbi:sulfotransferase [Geomonas oryzisoli]|uniref:Sulfotransferase n=1 Tax=Geomonas oryzisoli TaxID=2847992 RepID=A0ABX8J6V3_9BACT|nr:sulfotransferase [Geomonas oryzisoli]QWV92457.1 sulfotransferase [Geomonas oryzisoli]